MKQDAGLQAQRTALAWRRTALTALVCALLAARSGLEQHAAWLIALSALLAMATLLLAVCAVWRARALLRSAMPQCVAAHWMRSAAMAATVCCLIAVVLMVGV